MVLVEVSPFHPGALPHVDVQGVPVSLLDLVADYLDYLAVNIVSSMNETLKMFY